MAIMRVRNELGTAMRDSIPNPNKTIYRSCKKRKEKGEIKSSKLKKEKEWSILVSMILKDIEHMDGVMKSTKGAQIFEMWR